MMIKKIQLINSIKTYAFEKRKHLVSEKEEIKCKKYNKTIQNLMMLQKKNIKEHNPN